MQRSRVTPRVTAKFSMSPPGARRHCQPPTSPLTAAARHHLPLTALHSFAATAVATARRHCCSHRRRRRARGARRRARPARHRHRHQRLHRGALACAACARALPPAAVCPPHHLQAVSLGCWSLGQCRGVRAARPVRTVALAAPPAIVGGPLAPLSPCFGLRRLRARCLPPPCARLTTCRPFHWAAGRSACAEAFGRQGPCAP